MMIEFFLDFYSQVMELFVYLEVTMLPFTVLQYWDSLIEVLYV